ncbi:CPBP family intramembrane metalloprotease domain-containing protein, partial [Kribbella albertanoniae]
MTSSVGEPGTAVLASRRVLGREVWLVLALSLGASGVAALISFT